MLNCLSCLKCISSLDRLEFYNIIIEVKTTFKVFKICVNIDRSVGCRGMLSSNVYLHMFSQLSCLV